MTQIKYRTIKGSTAGEWKAPLNRGEGLHIPVWQMQTVDYIEVTQREEFEVDDKFTASGYIITIKQVMVGKKTNCEDYTYYLTEWHDEDDGEVFFDVTGEGSLRNYTRL